MRYVLNRGRLQEVMSKLRRKGYKPKLVWMSPEEYLRIVMGTWGYIFPPRPESLGRWRLLDVAKYSRVRKAFRAGIPLPPLYLNTKERLPTGEPVHDGRHRAYVALSFGVPKVPVVVVELV